MGATPGFGMNPQDSKWPLYVVNAPAMREEDDGVLEEVDRELSRIIKLLDDFHSTIDNYTMKNDIDRLTNILSVANQMVIDMIGG